VKRTACALMLAALTSGASAQGLVDMGWGWNSDAKVVDIDGAFNVWVYRPRNHDSLLLEPRMSEILGGAGAVSHWPIAFWRHAAEAFVRPVGCGISDVQAISKDGAAWRALYVCPPGVDLRALVMAQRPALQQGQPLHPATPATNARPWPRAGRAPKAAQTTAAFELGTSGSKAAF
jgi:hypothetical protein